MVAIPIRARSECAAPGAGPRTRPDALISRNILSKSLKQSCSASKLSVWAASLIRAPGHQRACDRHEPPPGACRGSWVRQSSPNQVPA